MKDYKWLQLFAEGEGGDTGASVEASPQTQAETGEASSPDAQMDEMMSRIPERGRGAFKEAYEQTRKSTPQAEEPATEPVTHVPYADLIKSDEYKAEHKAWADKAFSERFKAKDSEIAGLNESIAKMKDVLGRLAPKYGLDPNSDNFVDEVSQRLASDDSIIEEYAMQHDMSVEEAKRNLDLQNKIQKMEAEERQRQMDEQNRQLTQALLFHADQTRKQFPEFDLDNEWKDERFRKEVFSHGMDTTVAYQIVHMDEILHRVTTQETAKAKAAITQSIASGQNRPMESGLSRQPAAMVRTTPSFDGMSTRQMREYAEKNLKR